MSRVWINGLLLVAAGTVLGAGLRTSLEFPDPKSIAPFLEASALVSADTSDISSKFDQLSGLARSKELINCLENPSLADSKALLEIIPPRSLHRSLIIERGIQVAPRSWIAHLKNIDDQLFTYALHHWAKQDPEAAFRASLQEPGYVSDSLLAAISRDHPELAMRLLESTRGPANSVHSIDQDYMKHLLSTKGTELALAAAMQAHSRDRRLTRLSFILPHWAKEAPDEALNWVQTHLSGQDRERLTRQCLCWAANSHPDWAWDQALELPAGTTRTDVFSNALAAKAKHDIATAKAWLRSDATSGMRDKLLFAILKALEHEPRALLETASELHPGLMTNDSDPDLLELLHDTIVFEIAGDDPLEALAWLGRLPWAASQSLRMDELLPLLEETDPQAHFDWITQMPAGQVQQRALLNLAKSNPADTLRWLINDSPIMDKGSLFQAAAIWVGEAPDEASVFISQIERGAARDIAIHGMIHLLLAETPDQWDVQAAFHWANEIEKESVRTNVISRIEEWIRERSETIDITSLLGTEEDLP